MALFRILAVVLALGLVAPAVFAEEGAGYTRDIASKGKQKKKNKKNKKSKKAKKKKHAMKHKSHSPSEAPSSKDMAPGAAPMPAAHGDDLPKPSAQ